MMPAGSEMRESTSVIDIQYRPPPPSEDGVDLQCVVIRLREEH